MNMIDEDHKMLLVLNEFSRVLGFAYDKLQGCRYEIAEQYQTIGGYKRMAAVFKPETTSLELELKEDYVVGSSFGLIGTIVVYITPSETEPSFKPCQMLFRFDLTLEITNN